MQSTSRDGAVGSDVLNSLPACSIIDENVQAKHPGKVQAMFSQLLTYVRRVV